jgi:hypothetical protein
VTTGGLDGIDITLHTDNAGTASIHVRSKHHCIASSPPLRSDAVVNVDTSHAISLHRRRERRGGSFDTSVVPYSTRDTYKECKAAVMVWIWRIVFDNTDQRQGGCTEAVVF